MGGRRDRLSPERAAALLGALAANEPGALAGWLAANRPDASWGRWIQAQGLAPYAFHRLRATDNLAVLPDDLKAFLRADYYQGIALNTLQRQEAEQVLAALERAGVETVLLKGTPLAYTVYDDPLCRFKGDLDIWIRFEQLAEATAAIQGAGYRVACNVERPPELTLLVGGEQQMVSDLPGTGLIELQWPAFRGEWVRHTTRIDHELVWARRMPVRIEGRVAYVMAPEDLLIHLCLHQAINHQFARPWLRNLLDVHLVIQRLAPDWGQVCARARSWRVSTVMWTVLSLAEELLGTAVPSEAMMALSPAGWRPWAIGRLRLERGLIEMSPGGYRHRRFLIQMLMIDRFQDAMRLVWCGMFPESTWLRARYGISTPGAIWRARLTHPLRLFLSARA